jgi:biotin operon repressor
MKVKYLTIKFMNGNFEILDKIGALSGKEYSFFKEVVERTDAAQNFIVAGDNMEHMMKKLNISESSFWNRVKTLQEAGILIKKQRGIYMLNKNFIRIAVVDLEEEAQKRELKAKTQRPTYRRF